MAEYIKHKLPKDMNLILTSDWHVGSKAFHDEAASHIVERLQSEENTYAVFNGDAVEGKKLDSPHFDPETLRDRQMRAGVQFERFAEIIAPSAKKWIGLGLGNHDIYYKDGADLMKWIVSRPLGIPQGGYQTWYDLGNGVRIHAYHGRSSPPRGAKDPVQREANQRAWLVNKLSPLAGDVHCHIMGHSHSLIIQPPLKQYALLSNSRGAGVRARYFEEPTQNVTTENPVTGKKDVRKFVPPYSRWYVNTGTLRRSGGFGFVDYAEIGGYSPSPVGYAEMIIRDGKIRDIEPVIL